LREIQRTLVLVKPDGLQRGFVGEIISRFERKGFKIVALKMTRIPQDLAVQHYAAHVDKPFFAGLVEFITSGPVVALVLEGDGVVHAVREVMGDTNPLQSRPGTIRGDLAVAIGRNIVHGSDSAESAEQEIKLFFGADEIIAWSRNIDPWVIES